MSQPYHDFILQIRAFFAQALRAESFTAADIARALNVGRAETQTALMDMLQRELIASHESGGKIYYFRNASFLPRQITPIFAGTPEWIVEDYANTLVCWCPSEFTARLIADALNRS